MTKIEVQGPLKLPPARKECLLQGKCASIDAERSIISEEAIAGKCRVVCTSNDSQNRQPSPEELRMADYVFHHTFNVGSHMILEKIDDKVVDVEARFLLNRECDQLSSDVRVEKEVIGNVEGCKGELRRCPELNKEGAFSNEVVADKAGPSMLKKEESSKISVNQDSLTVKDLGADSGAKTMEIEVPGVLQDSVPLSRKKLSHPLTDPHMDEVDAFMLISKVEDKGELRRCPELNTEGAFPNEVVAGKAGHSMLKKGESSKISVNQDSLAVKDLGADSGGKTMEIEVPGVLQDSVQLSRKMLSHPLTDPRMEEVDAGMLTSKLEDKYLKISEDLGLDDKPAKKARIDSSRKLPVKHKDGPSMLKKDESSKISLNQDFLLVKDLGADSGAKTMEIEAPGVLQESVPLSKKKLSHPRSDSHIDEIDAGIPICIGEGKNLKISDHLGLDDKPAKKARIDSSVKLPVKQSILQKEEKAVENDMLQVPGTVVCDDDRKQSKPLKDLPRPDRGSFKKVKPDEKASKKTNSTVAKTKAVNAAEENVISEEQVMDVSRKPDGDWDERIKGTYEKGTLVPAYSSSEIEDIIWSGFRESSTAKVVPQTAISSLLSGQASVVFKSRDVADTAMLSHPLTDPRMEEVDAGMLISKLEDKYLKISEDLGLDDKYAKKARIDSSGKLPLKHKDGPSMLKKDESSKFSLNQDSLLVKDLGVDSGAKTMEIEALGVLQESVPLSKKKLSHPRSDSRMDEIDAGIPICLCEDKNLKISDDLGLDDKPAKKARIDSSVKLPVKHSILQKEEKAVENDMIQVPGTVVCDDDGKQSKPLKDLPRPDKGSFKKVKPDEKASKKSNSTVAKTKAVNAAEENVISEEQVMDVTRKSDRDRSRWFKELDWDERIKGAHEKGTLVVENLDPTYSSSEIEDIIWSSFRESCTAKVVPQTAISSPHSGQASVVFKSRDAVDTAIRKLSEWCLMLPNGRPLVASYGTPVLHGNASTYLGHLDVTRKNLNDLSRKKLYQHLITLNLAQLSMTWPWNGVDYKNHRKRRGKICTREQGESLQKLKAKLKSKLI